MIYFYDGSGQKKGDFMKKNYFTAAGVFSVLFLLLIVLVKTVDVAQIGPAGTSIGLAGLNGGFHEAVGEHLIWYKLTEGLGVLALLVAALFAFVGLMQLIQRKSLLKVDRNILALGLLYIVMVICYVFFEVVIVNYRPIIMPGETLPEASFPSSHTMLICVIMGSAMMQIREYAHKPQTGRILYIVCWAILIVTVVGRLICGVHWFTDILGGLLLSAALLCCYRGAIEKK